MVSLPYPFYSQKHAANLSYPTAAPAWYPNYSTHQQQMNHHLLNGAPAMATGLETDTPSFYSHPMLPPHHSTSPDWVTHDGYNALPAAAAAAAANQQFFSNGMTTPASSIHMSPSNNQTHSASTSVNTNGPENLQNGLQNIPPSPPITVNSACSEISSPGIASNGNGNGNGGVIANGGDASPNMLNRPKSGYDWMKKQTYQSQPSAGKTRTKDKYRVVYTDFQRLELEKEYHMSHYITIRRKAELAVSLQLSERQVKIWFQNRRAKDRKQTKKRDPSVPSGMGSGMLSNGSANLSLALQHHNMGAGPSGLGASSMYGPLDIKPKLEPGLLSHNHHHSHNYGHLHQAHHAAAAHAHPMHHLSTMGMNLLHQSHMAHHSAASVLQTPISSAPTSIQSQAHLSSSI